jgi:hypothetical protein
MKPHPALSLLAVTTWALSIVQAPAANLQEFLGTDPLRMQKLWDGPGGTSVVVAMDGSILAFEGTAGNGVVRSTDGGQTWSDPIVIGTQAYDGNAIVDEVAGHVLYVNPAVGSLWRSTNHGQTWQPQSITIAPDAVGLRGLDVRYMQPGITIT